MHLIKVYRTKRPKNKVWVRVSKKVSKKAVVRNQVKRRIRAVLSEVSKDLSPYVISALPGAEKITFTELKRTLLNHINRL